MLFQSPSGISHDLSTQTCAPLYIHRAVTPLDLLHSLYNFFPTFLLVLLLHPIVNFDPRQGDVHVL